jgi:aspartyl-tRNA(Asn)/glutamyl-tRNA(Gln) amidotransferase subunit A
LEEVRHQINILMETYDLLMTPTMAVPAFPIGEYPSTIGGASVSADWGFNPFNLIFNLTGQPAASIPCGFSTDGMPIGLHIIGRMGEEATVLAASAAFEQVRPWSEVDPEVD